MKKPALLALLAVAALGTGCAGLTNLARVAFKDPKLTFRSATVEALDLEGATLGVKFDLENTNGFGLDVARVGWGVEVEGTRIATGDMPGGLAIPANGVAPLTIPVRIRYQDVPGIVGLLTSRRDAIAYRLSGKVGVRTPIGVVDLPVSHSDRLALPSLPSFSLEGVSLRTASLTEMALDVKVRVKNPNAFPLPAGRLDYALSLAGSEVASARDSALARVAGGAAQTIAIPVRLNVFRAGRAATDLARGAPVRLGLAGTAEVAGIPLPLALDATVPVGR
ncbi:LEA type 2 family protein [Anaeromyxobacter sp. SG17]|uniref:LEA type 2 family protein n=1 Tax=Anaeromyxobacter sp. SG17 TaxID=2925405 RepID=UPI001F58DC5E|nr:LEA type 2 family protein [Anaeromyxobacter sp. SG17]